MHSYEELGSRTNVLSIDKKLYVISYIYPVLLGDRQKKLKVDFDKNDRDVAKMHTFVQAHFRLFDFFFIFFEIFYFFSIRRSNALSYTRYSKYFQAVRINAGVDKLLHNGYGPCS